MKLTYLPAFLMLLAAASVSPHEIGVPMILKGHTDAIWADAFSPDGKSLATASDDKTIRLWQVDTGKNILTLRGHVDALRRVQYSADGKTLISVSAGHMIKLWDFAMGTDLATCELPADFRHSIAIAPDGKTAASTNEHGTIKLWDIASGKNTASIETDGTCVEYLAFNPNGRILASHGRNGANKLWDPSSGDGIGNLDSDFGIFVRLSFDHDGKNLLSWNHEQEIQVWDLSSRKRIVLTKMPKRMGPPIALRPNVRAFVAVEPFGFGGKTLVLWDLMNNKAVATLDEHTDIVQFAAYSPDARSLVSGSRSEIILWDLSAGKAVAKRHWNINDRQLSRSVFSPDGKALAVLGSGCTVTLIPLSLKETKMPSTEFR